MRIEVLRQLIQLLVFGGAGIQKAVGKLATHPERWFTSALLIHRFAVPLPRWGRQRNGPLNPHVTIQPSKAVYPQERQGSLEKDRSPACEQ